MSIALEHDRPTRAGSAGQAPHQAALPDARLAFDQQHCRLTGPDIPHHGSDQLQLKVSSHETFCQRRSHKFESTDRLAPTGRRTCWYGDPAGAVA